jgi:uncharacterized protein YegL
MSKRKKSAGKLNLLLLISTLISAILTGIGMHYSHGVAFFMERNNRLFMPMYMAALFAVFFVITCLVVFLISNLNLTYRADVISGRKNKGRIFLYIVIGIALISLLLLGAEFLYETNFQRGTKGAGTYVFLIDDSGTMENNDPAMMRYSVIESMLRDKPGKTQYAVYSFSSDVKVQVPMRTVADGFPSRPAPDYRMTDMKAGLEKVISDCEQGVWTGKGATTLILITDGDPSDFSHFHEIKPVLDRYINQGIQVGIVGVIGADNALMNEMATYTGGTFTDITDAELMGEAVGIVAGNTGRSRDLLSERDAVQMNWVYAMIRILAFGLAGALMAVGAALSYGNNTVFSFIVWTNVIKAILAGVLMEVAFVLPLNSAILRLIAWILLGTIIARCGSVDEPELDGKADIDFFEAPAKGRNASNYYF